MARGEVSGDVDAAAAPGRSGRRARGAGSLGSSLAGRSRDGRARDRDRIVAATMDVVATVGFARAQVEDIVAVAGVGRRKFWTHFSGKHAAVVFGYRQITADLRAAVRAAHDAEPDPVRRVTACLTAMAEFLAADPVRADVFLVQGPAAGREVIEIRTDTMRRLGALLATTVAEIARCPAGTPDRSQIVIESLAGGLYEVAYMRTFRGEVHTLPGLVPDLARLVLTPYRDRAAA